MNYTTIDYLPDLTTSAMSTAQVLTFQPYTSTYSSIAWDYSATYSTSASYAALNSTFSWTGREGATYDIFSHSYFDPFLIQVYDSFGNVIATDTSGIYDTYGTDYVWDFVAPYSGTYYVSAGWDQGLADSHKFVSLYIYEDVDTADTTAPTVSIFSPADAATGVDIASNIAVTFSEAVQRGTGSIVLTNAAGTTIETFNAATSSNLSISGTTLTINPTSDLANSTNYFVTFASGSITDLAGNAYAGTITYDFTTIDLNVSSGASVWQNLVVSSASYANTPNSGTLVINALPSTASTITGSSGVDIITGSSAGDNLNGGAGNDVFSGGAGNDIIDGGAGKDIAIYSGS